LAFLARAALFGALVASLWATPAAAQVCTQVTTVAVAFGPYNERSATPMNGTGQVRVQCDAGVPYQVRLDPGSHSGGTFSPRVMADGGGLYQLQYNLFIDSGRTVIWGDGTGVTQVVTGVAQGAQDILQVYGRVFALQPVGVGAYADTVTVTVEY
jgi:spore coat protein U domain-containing protein, fimbrial subunit CupE1/2/3/6